MGWLPFSMCLNSVLNVDCESFQPGEGPSKSSMGPVCDCENFASGNGSFAAPVQAGAGLVAVCDASTGPGLQSQNYSCF